MSNKTLIIDSVTAFRGLLNDQSADITEYRFEVVNNTLPTPTLTLPKPSRHERDEPAGGAEAGWQYARRRRKRST